MFIDQSAQRNFEGKDGEEIATSVLDLTQAELDQLRGTLGDRVGDEAANLQLRINRQRDNLNTSYEADTRRSITEEARTIRQEISKIRENPDNIGTLLRAEINAVSTRFNAAIRPRANAAVAERFEKLAQQAREAVAQGKIADAKRSLAEMRSVSYEELYKDPSFVINSFLKLAQERHLALDKALHDRTVEAGKASTARQDLNGVQRAINQIMENRIPTGPKSGSNDATCRTHEVVNFMSGFPWFPLGHSIPGCIVGPLRKEEFWLSDHCDPGAGQGRFDCRRWVSRKQCRRKARKFAYSWLHQI